MRFVAPRTGASEITLAEEQEEYMPLVAALYRNSHYPDATVMLVRVTLTDEERALVFGGEDIYITQLVFPGHRFTPLTCQVGPGVFLQPDKEDEA